MSEPDTDVVYGLLTLAGMEVALPLSALREVVSCPADMDGLPVAATGLLGAMKLRTLVLPVVDLRPVIGRPEERTADEVVVVVAHGGQVLGLVADEVRGVTRVPTSALLPVTAAGGDLLFSHAFRHPVTGAIVSVLDAAAVLRRPGVPTVADARSANAERDDAARAGREGVGAQNGTGGKDVAVARSVKSGRKLTLLRCGPYVLALDVTQVHTTLPASAARPSVLSSPLCRGVTDFVDREVPVVDPLVLLGLGQLPVEDNGAGLVLNFGHGYVVLALSALVDLTELAAGDVLPLPGFAVRRPDLLAGMAEVEGVGQCLVLDGEALLAETELASLASLNTSIGDAEIETPTTAVAAEAAAIGGRPYLTYSAGVDVATALEQITEILPFPATSTPTEVGDSVLGVTVYRSTAMPVLCLATLLGRTPGPVTAASCVLVVAVGGDRLAFAVDGLRAIDRLAWSDPAPPTDEPPDGLSKVLHCAPLVRIGDETRLLPDLDLLALAHSVRGSTEHGAPEPNETLVTGGLLG